MIAVIFEVYVKEGKQEEYLQIASELREHLAHVAGFISIERFSSLVNEGKLYSLSFWDNEDSVKQWREFELHRLAQQKGKTEIFQGFRIRVAEVVRDYSMGAPVNRSIDIWNLFQNTTTYMGLQGIASNEVYLCTEHI